jgi:hypothetical protein
MGTSTDRGGGSGGAWTPLKRAATSFMNAADAGHGTRSAGQRLLGRHVPVLGGAAGALAGARAGRSGAQRLGSLLSGIASDGLAATLSGQGLGHLVGGDRFTVLDALAGLIAEDGSDIDAQAARDANFDVLADLFPDADSWADLDAVQVDAGQLVRLLEMFLARYIYNRIPVIAERLARITDPAKAQRAEEDLQRMVESFGRPTASRRPAARRLGRPRGQEGRRGHAADRLRGAGSAGGAVTAGLARFCIRTAPFDAPAGPGQLLLDWAPGSGAETIEFTPAFFEGWRPGTSGGELLRFAAGVYCADRVVPRKASPDAWTRDLRVEVPVADPAAWEQAPWPATLGFLTGDRWTLQPRPASPAAPPASAGLAVDAVSLFSGGLDSLCGVIDLLERNPGLRLLLIAHHEGGKASESGTAASRLMLRFSVVREVRFPTESGTAASRLPFRSSVVSAVRFPTQSGTAASLLKLKSSLVRDARSPTQVGTAVSCIPVSINCLPSSDRHPRNSCGIPKGHNPHITRKLLRQILTCPAPWSAEKVETG